MTPSPPPTVATWLMKRLGTNQALMGNLIEEYQRGRSRAWYWRQVLMAILVASYRDIRVHKMSAVRAGVITWAIVILWVESTWAVHLWVSHKWIIAMVTKHSLLFDLWILYGGGLQFVWCLGSGMSGWLNARLHRQHWAAMVLVSIISQIPLTLWWGLPIVPHALEFYRLGVFHSGFPAGVVTATILVGMPICTALGGLWGARGEDGTVRVRRVVASAME